MIRIPIEHFTKNKHQKRKNKKYENKQLFETRTKTGHRVKVGKFNCAE